MGCFLATIDEKMPTIIPEYTPVKKKRKRKRKRTVKPTDAINNNNNDRKRSVRVAKKRKRIDTTGYVYDVHSQQEEKKSNFIN